MLSYRIGNPSLRGSRFILKNRHKKFVSFLCFVALLILIEWAGHFFTFTSVGNWYQTLRQPKWNPPNWIFGPVWTTLYLMIAISGWLIFIKARTFKERKIGFCLYGAQLFFNFLWSFFFFFLKNPGLAFLDILILLSFISLNIFSFWKIYRPAAILLIPYLIWTLYAVTLNAAIWKLNS